MCLHVVDLSISHILNSPICPICEDSERVFINPAIELSKVLQAGLSWYDSSVLIPETKF